VTGITLPEQRADRTRCFVHFKPVAQAKTYDVWVSPYANGSGAIKLGSAWDKPGQLIQGLHADTDFYVFLVYADGEGNMSRPSPPFKIHLQDLFGFK